MILAASPTARLIAAHKRPVVTQVMFFLLLLLSFLVPPKSVDALKVEEQGRAAAGYSLADTSSTTTITTVLDPDSQGGLPRRLRLAVFCDPALLHHLANRYPARPRAALHQYVTTVVYALEDIMQQGVAVELKLVQIVVWEDETTVPFYTGGLTGGILKSFCEWVSALRPPMEDALYWNHAILLTGEDLFESTPSSIGTSFVDGMCHPHSSCSVVEAGTFKAVHVAAHELAHSMGVPHDGESGATECQREGFLMAQSLTQAFSWSTCSKDAFAAFLKRDNCLEKVQVREATQTRQDLDHTGGGLPGRRFTADDQCVIAFGPEFKAVASTSSICDNLSCTNGIMTQGAHPALAGTICGKNMECIAGTCSKSPSSNTPDIPPTIQPPSQPPNQPPNQPPFQPPNQPPFQPPNQPPFQPPNQPPFQPPNQPPFQPPNKPPFQPPNQPPFQPPNQPPFQPPNQPPFQPPFQPPNQPPFQPPFQPPNQPPNQPPFQPPNQPPFQPPFQPPNQPPFQPPSQPPNQPPFQPPNQPPFQPPFQPPNQPPFQPPNQPPFQPPNQPPFTPFSPEKQSVFPKATIPNEVSEIPIPLRCLLLPTFLHNYIGCDSINSTDSESASPSPSSSNSTPEFKFSPLARLLTPATISSTELESASVPAYGRNEDVQVHSNHEFSEETSPHRNTSLSTVTSSSFSHPDSLSSLYSSLPAVISKPRVTSTTPHNIVTEKRGRVYESIRKERRAEKSHVEDTRSEGGHVLSDINRAFEGYKNKIYEEKEEVDEKEEKQREGEEQFVDGVTFTPEVHSVTSPEATKQTFTPSNVNDQDIAARDSMEHNTTIQNVALPSPPGNDANIVDVKEDVYRVTDKGREEKGEDGSDGDCMNTTNKCDSHTSGDSRSTPRSVDNMSMTGSDLEGEKAQSNVGEGSKVVVWTPPRLNMTAFGLYVPMPPEFLRHLLAPLFLESRRGTSSISPTDRPITLLRDSATQPPVLTATAPSHARRSVASSCSRSCGGGIRTISQVCVEVAAPEKQVPEEKCLGLPNYQAPFNQICNTFPCHKPRWMAGSWSNCSKWCGIGLQRRLVGCGVPLFQETISSLAVALFVKPSGCSGDQPINVRVCEGQCSPVDCSLPSNILHLACYNNLQDPSLEEDHPIDHAVHLTSETTG